MGEGERGVGEDSGGERSATMKVSSTEPVGIKKQKSANDGDDSQRAREDAPSN